MKSNQIPELMAEFETNHSVENYSIYGWNAWPFLKVQTAYELLHPSAYRKVARDPGLLSPVKNFVKGLPLVGDSVRKINNARGSLKGKKALKVALDKDRVHHDEADAPQKDVVIYTLSDRRLSMEQSLYDIYSGPMSELFAAQGISPLVWERGVERWPRSSNSAWVSRRLQVESKAVSNLAPLHKPAWFDEFAQFAAQLLKREICWDETSKKLIQLEQWAQVFEDWLRRSGAKLLVSVCWYDASVMAATLAARRLGLVSVDLQHGNQSSRHFAYFGWNKGPACGYELIPDYFWSWGSVQAERLFRENSVFAQHCRSVVGGNLWLNQCREKTNSWIEYERKTIRERIGPQVKTLLVTLNHGLEGYEALFAALERSPADWLWMFRFHPATPEDKRTQIESAIRQRAGGVAEFMIPNEFSLYALLCVSDVHLTIASTCALEALAFGVPSVILRWSGRNSYSDFIDKGVMICIENGEALYDAVASLETLSSQQCRSAAEAFFSSPSASVEAANELISVANFNSEL